jgi:hypothetical protein
MTSADSAGTRPTGRMRWILADHARRYPRWAVDDLYKLVHQASMGSEHAAGEEGRTREWLLREMNELRAGPDEPLVDPISPDGRIVRVHLRPFVACGLDPEPMLQAFLRTAERFSPSVERLVAYAEVAAGLAEEGTLRLPRARIVEWFDEMRAAGYPAVHHSPGFARSYRPAYRVVSLELLPREIIAAAGTNDAPGRAELGAG